MNTIWIVYGCQDDYESTYKYSLCFFDIKEQADTYKDLVQKECDYLEAEFEKEKEEIEKRVASMPQDDFDPNVSGYDEIEKAKLKFKNKYDNRFEVDNYLNYRYGVEEVKRGNLA